MAALALPAAVLAQAEGDAPEATVREQLLEIQVMSVHPSAVDAFEVAVAKMVATAEAAGLDGAFGWQTWTDFFEYTVVSSHENFAEFDDPEAWVRQFTGTEQESTVLAALEGFEALNVRALSRDVIEAESGWSYAPETVIEQASGAEIIEVWITPGKFEAFDEVTARAVAFYEQVGYPYAFTGYSTHFGNTSRMAFVTFFDDMASYVGDNRIEQLAAAAGRTDEWSDILDDFRQVTDDVQRSFQEYRPDLSYVVAESAVSDAGGT